MNVFDAGEVRKGDSRGRDRFFQQISAACSLHLIARTSESRSAPLAGRCRMLGGIGGRLKSGHMFATRLTDAVGRVRGRPAK